MLEYLSEICRPIVHYKSKSGAKNLFQCISDVHYRENFHSDIMAYYLSHDLAKRKFCEWLNDKIGNGNSLAFQDYQGGELYREEGKIDILMYRNDRSKCIIIENKSNQAVDQYRQLPRYYEWLSQRESLPEAIVYLNKSTSQPPSTEGWSDEEKKLILPLVIPTQLIGADSFVSQVVDKVIVESNDIRLSGLSHEMKLLFNLVVYGEMNMEDLSEFIRELRMNDNLEKLNNSIQAFNDLPAYWREYYVERLEICKKQGIINAELRIGRYHETCVFVDNFVVGKVNYGFDIWFFNHNVDFSLLTRNGNDNDIEELKCRMGSKWPFGSEMQGGRYRHVIENTLNEDEILRFAKKVIALLEECSSN